MEFSKPYINENISTSLLRDIEDVKRELEILSNEAIWNYYSFSSSECDNIMLNVGLKNIDQSRKRFKSLLKRLINYIL